MRVVITGAAGKIAAQLIEELSAAHDLCLIDLVPIKSHRSIAADLKRPESGWRDAFVAADVVVHLAANIQATASWPEVVGDNIEATRNVLEAAAMHRVRRVVFASSGWAVKALELKLAPDCYLANGPKIDSDVRPCPVNPYGLSKAFGETAGRMFVDQDRLQSFVAVRIGDYNPNATKEDETINLWVGAQDLRALFSRCVNVGFSGFHVVYAVSAQSSAPYDLTHTESLLSWKPAQHLPESFVDRA